MYQIVDAPIPEKQLGTKAKPKYPFHSLNVNQSFFVPVKGAFAPGIGEHDPRLESNPLTLANAVSKANKRWDGERVFTYKRLNDWWIQVWRVR